MATGAPSRATHLILLALPFITGLGQTRAQTPVITGTPATYTQLVLPRGLAYDSNGNLFFAETGSHVIRKVSQDGLLTVAAGTGVQGFSGDGGPATAAALDSPSALAVDAADNIFFADTHNHRIRRIDAVSGRITTFAGDGAPGLSPDGTLATAAHLTLPSALAIDSAENVFFADAGTNVVGRIDHASGKVTTVAGNGTQGFSGDGGAARLAAIDTPWGLAVNALGDLFLADTHNQRVRRVDHLTGIISSVVGDGAARFAGDLSRATAASLNLPHGLVIDPAGNLFVADAGNQRVRRVDANTGAISTIAGEGTEAFAGEAQPAVSASLDTPSAAAISPAGLLVISDSANQRVREIDSAAVLHTIAGIAPASFTRLLLSAPAAIQYGTGSLAATFSPGGPTGAALFIDLSAGATQLLPAVAFTGDTATLDTSSFAAGIHRVSASYNGDSLHAAAQSAALNVVISPAPLLVTPHSIQLLYGQPIPALTADLSGLLTQDSSSVAIKLSSSAAMLAAPARFPITASISGSAAGNYALTSAPAFVTILRASPLITLSDALAVHVSSAAGGTPGGIVTLLDGATPYASAALSPGGDAVFSPASLSGGSHTLTATYAGDLDFLPATSTPALFSAGAATASDFAITATGPVLLSVVGGSPAVFNFDISPINGGLSSPILLTATGLPLGATTSFSPAYIPPSSTDITFTLTIQTLKSAAIASASLRSQEQPYALAFAAALPLLFFMRKRSRKQLPRVALLAAMFTCALGCGDRTTHIAIASTARTSTMTVLATATSASGATLQHTVNITLITTQ